MQGITYKEYCEQRGLTVQCVRMKINRAIEKGLLTKTSVYENTQIPNEVLSFLTGSAAVSTIAPVQKEVAVKRQKAAKQATIPMQVNNSVFAVDQEPVKSQMSSIFSFLRSLSSADKAMATICVITAYGLISQYRFMGLGAAVAYSIFALNTSRLTKKEHSLQSAKMSVNWLIFFDIALAYVHSTMYYREITGNNELMINKEGWGLIVTSCAFGIGTSLVAVITLLVSIKETWEKAEHNYQNA